MDGKKKENVVKGGPSTLRKMLKLKYPSLSLNELSKLILKIKENHGIFDRSSVWGNTEINQN